MAMSVSFHPNNFNRDEVACEAYVTKTSYSDAHYAVVKVTMGFGENNQEINMFMNEEQVHALKLALAKAEREFKKVASE